MNDTYTKPVYLPKKRLQRFFIYFFIAVLLSSGYFLPFSIFLICMQLAFISVLMAIFQWWEWQRLTPYDEFRMEKDCFLYRYKGQDIRLIFTDIAVSFLYYSSFDKRKGCATLGLRLKNGKTYRFCGITQVDKLLPKIYLSDVKAKELENK